MSRSVKKGPYVEERLMKRIIAMNESGELKPVKPGQGLPPSSPKWSVTRSPFTTEESTFPYSLPKK